MIHSFEALAVRLQSDECCPPAASAFQYILTTTTHLPTDMQEGSPWLLGSCLSGKTKNRRLLKEDF
jgi:hypothetical protein